MLLKWFFKDFRLQSRSQCQCQAADHLLLPQTKSDKKEEQIELRTSRVAGWAEITTVKGFTKADDHKKSVKLFSHRYLNVIACDDASFGGTHKNSLIHLYQMLSGWQVGPSIICLCSIESADAVKHHIG